jgi:hypothetical protein
VLPADLRELDRDAERDTTVRFLSPFDRYLWMRKPLLSLGEFSPTNVGIYSVIIGGTMVASFHLTRRKGSLLLGNPRVFQNSLLRSRSAEIKREIEMHATSTNRSVKYSSNVRALLG